MVELEETESLRLELGEREPLNECEVEEEGELLEEPVEAGEEEGLSDKEIEGLGVPESEGEIVKEMEEVTLGDKETEEESVEEEDADPVADTEGLLVPEDDGEEVEEIELALPETEDDTDPVEVAVEEPVELIVAL